MYAPAESVEFLATEVTVAPGYALEALRLPAGGQAIRRARLLRGGDGAPIEVSTSWFAPDLAAPAPGLLEPRRLAGGTARYLTDITGQVPAYARDQVAARLATAEERALLDLADPAAVLVYRLTVYDTKDAPVQFDEATYPPTAWVFQQEYPLPR